MPLWFVPAAFAAKWAAVRFAQHGGDKDATWEALQNDLVGALTSGAKFVRKGVDATTDAAKLTTAIVNVRYTADFQSLVQGTHALSRALEHLPEETLAGLRKSIDLNERIDDALASGMYRCGTKLLEAPPDTSANGEKLLEQNYFGLYLVGRSGTELTPEERVAVRNNLAVLHEARGGGFVSPEIEESLRSFTGSPEESATLASLLAEVAEFIGTASDPQYIVRALGGDIAAENEESLMELLLRFPEE